MRKPHFFKAYSRLGIHNLPSGASNGVEKAADNILSDEFLDSLDNPLVTSFSFSNPEQIKSLNLYQTILKESLKFKNLIAKKNKEDETIVVIGGDHSITFPSILADIDRFGTNIGVIHFDSHGDFNLYETSPSRNFHGMYLRIIFDKFDLKSFYLITPNKIPISNLLFIGDLELDPEEKAFIQKNNLPVITRTNMSVRKKESLELINKFIRRFEHIHISFDVDVFKKAIAPATTTPSKKGFTKKPVFEILKIIKEAKSITLDIAEVNPKKEGKDQTIKIAQEVIKTFF